MNEAVKSQSILTMYTMFNFACADMEGGEWMVAKSKWQYSPLLGTQSFFMIENPDYSAQGEAQPMPRMPPWNATVTPHRLPWLENSSRMAVRYIVAVRLARSRWDSLLWRLNIITNEIQGLYLPAVAACIQRELSPGATMIFKPWASKALLMICCPTGRNLLFKDSIFSGLSLKVRDFSRSFCSVYAMVVIISDCIDLRLA